MAFWDKYLEENEDLTKTNESEENINTKKIGPESGSGPVKKSNQDSEEFETSQEFMLDLDNADYLTIWEALSRVERQLSGNRSPDFKRRLKPVKVKIQKYLISRGKL